MIIETARLRLVLESTEAILARIEAMSPADRAAVSPDWLARLGGAAMSPWTHGFAMVDSITGVVVGTCAFKGPPGSDGAVEVAYAVEPSFQGRGFAKEATAALVEVALHAGARVVRAHTRPEHGASPRVLAACGFERVGDVLDPEDGLVWRWELVPRPAQQSTQ